MRFVFFGSADFGIPMLEQLLACHEVVGIVSTPAKPKGRGLQPADSPVVEFAKAHSLGPILTPGHLKDNPELAGQLRSLEADLFVVVAFRILPPSIFTIPRLGTVNVHASLLPKFRGPAPIQRAIEAGETTTGVTVFRIDEGVDTGEVLLQRETAIGPREAAPELYSRLSLMGAEALMEAVGMLESGKVRPVPQVAGQATRAPKLTKEEGHLSFADSATAIFNRIRAFKPFPGTFAFLNGKRLGILWAEPVASETGTEPGTVAATSDDDFTVQCGRGSLKVTKVKPEGRRSMNVHDFLLGTPIVQGTKLE